MTKCKMSLTAEGCWKDQQIEEKFISEEGGGGAPGSSDTLKYIIAVSLSKWIKSLALKFLQIYQCSVGRTHRPGHQCPMCVFWTQFCIFSANWDMCQVCPCLITDLVSIDARFYHWMNICVNLLFIVTSICRSIHLCQFILSILRSAVSTDSSVNHCQS